MLRLLKVMAEDALDLVYPPALYCICCGKIIDETRPYRLCNDCMDGMKWATEQTCAKCGKRLSAVNPGRICFSCREHPHQFDRGFTCAEYGTHERAMVFALKYNGRSDIAETIGEIMADRMLSEFGQEELSDMYDLVLPVPVHPHKKRTRGYNQAALIAESFCSRTGLKCNDSILIRVRETHVMRSLGPDQRRENIRGAFALKRSGERETAGKRILLIDDIYTTGATVDEIASLLKHPGSSGGKDPGAGAERVDFLSFASGADVVKTI